MINTVIALLAALYFTVALVRPALIIRFYRFWTKKDIHYSEQSIRLGALVFVLIGALIILLVPRR